METTVLETYREQVERKLHEKDFPYLNVLKQDIHLIIYSEQKGKKAYRVRFTWIGQDTFELELELGRRWQSTFFTGTVSELMEILIEQFPFALVEW